MAKIYPFNKKLYDSSFLPPFYPFSCRGGIHLVNYENSRPLQGGYLVTPEKYGLLLVRAELR